jgi:hypothetical protein
VPDLGTQLRSYVDATAPPIELDEVAAVAPVEGRAEPRRAPAWLLAAAALVVFALVVAGVVAVARSGGRGAEPGGLRAGPSAPSTPTDPQWLTPYGTETPAPAIPTGWQVVDVADVRFAVPNSWQVVGQQPACWPPYAGGYVWLIGADRNTECSPPTNRAAQVTIQWSTAVDVGPTVRVGTLMAHEVIEKCIDCGTAYRFADGLLVTARGPEAARILATFTDSGRRRALQQGPVADTASWQTVSYQGVAFRVPRDWVVTDLARSSHRTTSPNGTITGFGGVPNPGSCGQMWFGTERADVFLGISPIGEQSCPSFNRLSLYAGDGAWIRQQIGPTDAATTGPVVGHGVLGGLGVSVLGSSTDLSEQPVLHVLVSSPKGEQILSIGVGDDASVVRAILLSIHAA